VEDDVLLRAHSREHLRRLDSAMDFDADTPAHPGIAAHARRSVGGALQALQCALRGERSFSLLRPPGHHATRDRAMGFCLFNNVAIAARWLQAEAGVRRVAILDWDVHHGNGTEEIVLDQPGLTFSSIHQFPAYPGTGRRHRGENCLNYPVAPGLSREGYRVVASQAIDALSQTKPELLAVSAGFDAYARDPLCQQQLEAEDYHWLGRTLTELGVPMFSLLEGATVAICRS
jgi:acetoin utilization deacetylase AcuC-like enzyme